MPRDVWPHVKVLLVGLGQEVQTEKAKLLGKAAACSRPAAAFALCQTLGVDVAKQAAAAGIALPEGSLAPAIDAD